MHLPKIFNLVLVKVKVVTFSLFTFVSKKVTFRGIGIAVLGGFSSVAGLKMALSYLFLYLCGPPKHKLPREVRLAHVLTALEITQTTLANKQDEYIHRLDRIGRFLENITSGQVRGPMLKRLRKGLEANVKTQKRVLESRQFERLKLTIAILEEARRKLENGDQN